MKSQALIALTVVAGTWAIACNSGNKSDNERTRQPPNSRPVTNDAAQKSVQDLLTASYSSDKATRLNAIKGLETAFNSSSTNQNDLTQIGSRLAVIAQHDPDDDVRNEAIRVLSSANAKDDDKGSTPADDTANDGDGSTDGDDSHNNNNNNTGPMNDTFFGAVLKCVTSAEKTTYPSLPSTYEVMCSPILTGASYQKVQDLLAEWQNAHCKSPLFTDDARAFTGTDGKTYVPQFVPSYPQRTSSSKKSDVEFAVQNGVCKAASGTNYGQWVPKASN